MSRQQVIADALLEGGLADYSPDRASETVLAEAVERALDAHDRAEDTAFRCEAWLEGGGQCPAPGLMLLQFTGAIAVRVQVCPEHYATEHEFRQDIR